MSTRTLRTLIRILLEEKEDLLLEPKSEGSTAGASMAGGFEGVEGVLAEPDVAGVDDGNVDDDDSIDSGDGCEDVEDCEKEEQSDTKQEGSGAGAVAGAIVPLGAGPSYPAPDRRSPKTARRKTARAVGRAFGGATPARK